LTIILSPSMIPFFSVNRGLTMILSPSMITFFQSTEVWQ
jgi:hypothetical protein